jgi:hypothetical protein
MQLLGYGEDALTLWALSHRLPDIRSPLGDQASPTTTVYYRPSFGRRSATPGRSHGDRGPQFGEFDAIIATDRGVYLLEAKWSASGEIAGEQVDLRPEQIRRHQVFRRYLEAWTQAGQPDWGEFVGRYPRLVLQAPGGEERFRVAPAGTVLARNLEVVLRRCAKAGPVLADVLLVVHPQRSPGPRLTSGPAGFQVIELDCPAVVEGYISLGAW